MQKFKNQTIHDILRVPDKMGINSSSYLTKDEQAYFLKERDSLILKIKELNDRFDELQSTNNNLYLYCVGDEDNPDNDSLNARIKDKAERIEVIEADNIELKKKLNTLEKLSDRLDTLEIENKNLKDKLTQFNDLDFDFLKALNIKLKTLESKITINKGSIDDLYQFLNTLVDIKSRHKK